MTATPSSLRIRPGLVFSLAWRDLLHDRLLTLCVLIGLSAAAGPLLTLAGLHAGLIEGMRETLLEDPHIREISSATNRSFPAPWFAQMAAQPTVAFIMPRTRALAASVLLQSADAPDVTHRVELVPSAAGDPILPGGGPRADTQVILSSSAAASLHVHPNDTLNARISRFVDGHSDVAVLPLTVRAVAPAAVTTQDVGFVTLDMARGIEVFRESPQTWDDAMRQVTTAPAGAFAGFRLYARTLDDVPQLVQGLEGRDIGVMSHAGEIAGLEKMDHQVSLLLVMLAILAGGGFLSTLATSLWANVARKRQSLALLRFTGMRSPALVLFPVIQALLMSGGGLLVAWGGAAMVAVCINHVFAATMALDRPLCIISLRMVTKYSVMTLCCAAFVSLAAGWRASRINAWDGVVAS